MHYIPMYDVLPVCIVCKILKLYFEPLEFYVDSGTLCT